MSLDPPSAFPFASNRINGGKVAEDYATAKCCFRTSMFFASNRVSHVRGTFPNIWQSIWAKSVGTKMQSSCFDSALRASRITYSLALSTTRLQWSGHAAVGNWRIFTPTSFEWPSKQIKMRESHFVKIRVRSFCLKSCVIFWNKMNTLKRDGLSAKLNATKYRKIL